MKLKILLHFSIISILLFPPFVFATNVTIPFSSTYNCAECDASGTCSCDGIDIGPASGCCDNATYSASHAMLCGPYSVQYEAVTSNANYSSITGGRGQRHWLGDNNSNGSQGAWITFLGQTELWIRFYMRFQPGFRWDGGDSSWNVGYKTIFLKYGSGSNFAFFLQIYGSLGGMGYFNMYGTPAYSVDPCSSCGFQPYWTGGTGNTISDGSWHMMEFHIKSETGPSPNNTDGVLEVWVDNNLVISKYDMDHGLNSGGKTITGIDIGSNNHAANNGQCAYIDYDDIAISNVGYIGPITGQITGSFSGNVR
jgi:hypothetical protein